MCSRIGNKNVKENRNYKLTFAYPLTTDKSRFSVSK